MDEKRVYLLPNTNGVFQGDMKVTDDYSYNHDTHTFDICTPKVEIKLVGRICCSDEKTMVEEIEKFVKSFYL